MSHLPQFAQLAAELEPFQPAAVDDNVGIYVCVTILVPTIAYFVFGVHNRFYADTTRPCKTLFNSVFLTTFSYM